MVKETFFFSSSTFDVPLYRRNIDLDPRPCQRKTGNHLHIGPLIAASRQPTNDRHRGLPLQPIRRRQPINPKSSRITNVEEEQRPSRVCPLAMQWTNTELFGTRDRKRKLAVPTLDGEAVITGLAAMWQPDTSISADRWSHRAVLPRSLYQARRWTPECLASRPTCYKVSKLELSLVA